MKREWSASMPKDISPSDKLKQIKQFLSDPLHLVLSEDSAQWLIARVEQLEKHLKQCKIYSECHDELIMEIDEALNTGPKPE
jgi:hypothetical protein